MENKLELRVGDVVRLKPMTVRQIDNDGDLFFQGFRGLFEPDAVESIISRAETPEETIARLEAENAALRRDLQASEQEPDILINARGVCPCERDRMVVVWFRNGEKQTDQAGHFVWTIEKTNYDVFAYMVLPQ